MAEEAGAGSEALEVEKQQVAGDDEIDDEIQALEAEMAKMDDETQQVKEA